jgi:hypothetical protein
MVSHMKTTIQIPDSLFEEARQLAHRERTTLKALVTEKMLTGMTPRMPASSNLQKGRPHGLSRGHAFTNFSPL